MRLLKDFIKRVLDTSSREVKIFIDSYIKEKMNFGN